MLKSIQCPTCGGSADKEVLHRPVQCLYCDGWLATIEGKQQRIHVNRSQARALAQGGRIEIAVQPIDPVILFLARLKQVAPAIVCILFMGIVSTHTLIAVALIDPRDLPFYGEYLFELITVLTWLGAMMTGFGVMGAIVAAVVALSQFSMLVRQPMDLGGTEEVLIYLFSIVVPVVFLVVWRRAQDKYTLKHFLAKVVRLRLKMGLGVLIGGLLSVVFLSSV